MANDDNDFGRKKFRSPAYPSVALSDALEMAKRVYDAQRKHEAVLDSVVHALGYSSRSGASLRAVGALSHYGLLEKKGDKHKLSDNALDLLQLNSDDPRYRNALRECALSPAIHFALWERYGKCLPGDEAIRPFLLRDKGYGDSAVADVIQNYRETFEFAKLGLLEDDSEVVTEAVTPRNPVQTKDKPEQKVEIASISKAPEPMIPTLPITLGPNQIAAIPFPLTEAAFDFLQKALLLYKPVLVPPPNPPSPPAGIPDESNG